MRRAVSISHFLACQLTRAAPTQPISGTTSSSIFGFLTPTHDAALDQTWQSMLHAPPAVTPPTTAVCIMKKLASHRM
eukprot:CAMPEP_0173410056 /NCGR_PEP_ID=MMETSP1356-20130122/73677_1 /TAXON_ID=77927 ORGANISM="Hemiselmis virescens, Strain PCC157" /NCGR_SAMPLE_ID=MMETSP1356 /ASSEMBLY_ACC=CAM_ASM_000847 /LENGTH=76 /DNA_ID=CAMNT_0014371631 /DNA_START=805 /DNA_END=1035 /DNA_ORIENTATION=+